MQYVLQSPTECLFCSGPDTARDLTPLLPLVLTKDLTYIPGNRSCCCFSFVELRNFPKVTELMSVSLDTQTDVLKHTWLPSHN